MDLLKILTDFLKLQKERVVLNGQHLSWSDVLASVSQGLILGLLLFLIYVNDLSDGLQCNPKLFANGTSLFATVHNVNKATNDLNNDFTSHPLLTFNNIPITQMHSQKHLGMQQDKKLNFEEHLNKVDSNVNKTISIIPKLQNVLPRLALLTIYKSFIRSHWCPAGSVLPHGEKVPL